jgi:hypothetical protein
MKRVMALAFTILWASLILLLSSDAYAQLYKAESGVQTKPDGKTWSISLKEIERLPRVSVIEITTNGRPQSVGGSITLGCMMVKLARERDWRYVAQTSDSGVKKIGGLEKRDDDPARSLGDDFAGIDVKKNIDVEKLGWLCDAISHKDAPVINGQ